MAKVKVATVWLEGCAGCHMSFLDIDEAIVDLAEKVAFQRSPITDIKEFTPVDVGIVEGSVGNTEEEEALKELRANCKILMAWGDCACFGGVCAMRSSFDKEEALRRAYIETESTCEGKIPVPPGVPALLDQVKTGQSRSESGLLRTGLSARSWSHPVWPARATGRQNPGPPQRDDAL